ncbi:MAG: carboxypeptidase regulatory-like domain-containing protein [Myxococcaceae bacterium]|nr:carboxypeptidase regulatory-like domain-containing protein [Myxococcaceae bacterium]
MRKLILAATILVGLGLVLLFFVETGPREDSSASGQEGAEASGQGRAQEGRAGTALQPEHPEDLGARGTADAGSTPTLSQVPSEEDGVLDVEVLAGGRPVPGASVRLYWRGARDPNLGEVSWRLASADDTDAQGHARLASRPGGYLVAVRAQGYAPLLRDVVRPYGEERTHLSLTLEPGLALTGRTVVRGTQEPLPLVELVLTAHGRKLESWQRAEAPAEERVFATSDARGNFRVEGLAPGGYLLEARAVGHAREVLQGVKLPAAGPLTVALQVAGVIEGFVVDAQGNPAAGAEVQVSGRDPQVVTTGQGGGFSVEVEPGEHTVSARRGDEAGSLDRPVIVSAGRTVRDVWVRLGQGAVMEGRVVSRATGAPIAGASVDVSPYRQNGDSGRTVTDGEGRFSVGRLAPGSYDLVVSAPGFSELARRGLTVASGERFAVELQLTSTGAAEGQVRDTAGQPVQGAQVTGGSRWGGGLGNIPAEARTDAEGRYRLEGLSAGTLLLTASREGATLGVSQRVEVTEGGTAQVDFTLEETGTVEGVVRATGGALPASLAVTAFAQGRGRFSPSDMARAEIDTAGNFRMVLPPGSYGLQLRSEERWGFGGRRSQSVLVEAGKIVRTELSWQSDAREAGALQGIVLEPDGAPSPGAYVTLSTAQGYRGMRMMAPTDGEGRFSFSVPQGGEEAPSGLRLSARNGGRSGELEGVRPGAGEVVVRLRSAASVRGQVVRASGGAPVTGFTLTLQAPSSGRGFSPEDGPWEFPGDRFELREVAAEPVRLVVRTADGARGEALVSPASGATAEATISVRATTGVRGRVVDAITQATLPDAIVFIEGERLSGLDNGMAGDGRFVLEGVMPGERTLVITAGPTKARERRQVTLVEGQVLDVGDIALGKVALPPGVVGAMVSLDGGQLAVSHVLPESPAALAGLQVGDILLTVDGAPVATPTEAVQRLRGAPGSMVVLTVRRSGSERTLSIIRSP